MSKSASAFKKSTTITLPSGEEVEARKPSIKALVLHSPKGTVPEFLKGIVLSGMNGKTENPLETLKDKSDDEQLEMMAGLDDFTKLVVKATLVWPRIVENPDYEAGEIAYEDLSDEDTNFLSAWGMPKDAQAAATFPQEQGGGVESASDVPPVSPAPVELPEVAG